MSNVVKNRRWWNEAGNNLIEAVAEDVTPATQSLDEIAAKVRSAQHFVEHCEAELARAKSELRAHRTAMAERLKELDFSLRE